MVVLEVLRDGEQQQTLGYGMFESLARAGCCHFTLTSQDDPDGLASELQQFSVDMPFGTMLVLPQNITDGELQAIKDVRNGYEGGVGKWFVLIEAPLDCANLIQLAQRYAKELDCRNVAVMQFAGGLAATPTFEYGFDDFITLLVNHRWLIC